MTANDLQPKPFNIKVQDKEYLCKPIRMSHRLILARLTPFFKQFENAGNGEPIDLTAQQLLEFEAELNVLISDLIPALAGLTIEMDDIAEILSQIMNNILPDESKELKEAKVEVQNDPKAPEKIG